VLPTRVLQIVGSKEISLHVTTNKVAHYVCLSHCWGKHPVTTTTSQSLDEFRIRILWDKLPRTFQDAISFTYQLGYLYLWIDSLCIIQDSAEDWRHEGSRMADIYKNATLTLAATKSSDSTEGCFATSLDRHLSQNWRFVDAENTVYEIHVSREVDHERFLKPELPLLKRAWVLQEQLLSPRTVHFTTQKLVWGCSTHVTCECSNIGTYSFYRSLDKTMW
jgi:hypothetical protein